jgi:hypothetical protein
LASQFSRNWFWAPGPRIEHGEGVLTMGKVDFLMRAKSAIGRSIALIVLLALAGTAEASGVPETSAIAPPNLSEWGLHCWCLTARHTPQRIVRADNNGRLLRLAVGGVTRAELDRKLPGVTESQLALLQTYGLLTHDGDLYATAFPVFGPETIGPIRARLADLARHTAVQLRPDVETIAASARAQKHPGAAYAMVFGYALDGTLWDELPRRTPLPDTTLDLDHPFWRGAFWAIYPERSGAPGRNDATLGGRTLVAVWTDSTVNALNAKLHAAMAKGSPVDLSNLPIVIDRSGDPVHTAGHRIAKNLTAALVDSQEGRALLAQFPQGLRRQAVLAIAHEFIWSVMEELVRDRTVPPAPAFAPGQRGEKNLEDLMFIIEERTPS